MDRFTHYKNLKLYLSKSNYKDTPLSEIAAPLIARGVWGSWKSIVKFLFYMPNFKSKIRNFDTLLTFSFGNRKDHRKKLEIFRRNKSISATDCVEVSRSFCFNINSVYLIICSYFASLRIISSARGNIMSLADRFILFISTAYAIRQIEYFKKLGVKCNRYVAYNAADLEETTLCIILKRETTVYGLQHGMYFKFSDDIPLDIINVENICSSYFVCWGEYTKAEIGDYIKKGVEIIVSYDFDSDEGHEEFSPRESSDKILVLLPRLVYKKQILELIDILKELDNEKFLVKTHPSLEKDNLLMEDIVSEKNISIIDGDLNYVLSALSYKYIISFNSTAVFESLLFEQKVLVFESTSNEFKFPNTFSSLSKLNYYLNEEILAEGQDSKLYFSPRKDYFL